MKRFGFFNSINGDRKYLASDISEALDIATTTGIKQEEGVFEVTPYEDMTIKINPGSALILGCFYSNDEDELIKLDMADGELNRIDRIAIRYDRFDRSVNTVVIKGTNALNPTPPTPLRNENQFDLVLADIYIRKATTEILASDITDMRESELCGYIGVKGAVSQLEFDRHLADDVTQGNPHGIDAKANRALGAIYSATMTNGWGGAIHYCKNDVGMVAVYTKTSLTTGTVSDAVAQLPVGYRPIRAVYALVNKGNISPYDLAMGLSINSGGQIHIREPLRSLLTQGRNDGLDFHVVFQVDN